MNKKKQGQTVLIGFLSNFAWIKGLKEHILTDLSMTDYPVSNWRTCLIGIAAVWQ